MQCARIGFIGLGDQGVPIVRRLLGAGFSTSIWARRPDAAASLIVDGAILAESLIDLASHCDIVCICVRDDDDVIEVFEAMRGGLLPGSIIVVHSTVHPATCLVLAERVKDLGVNILDAPVSGGAVAARNGSLTVIAGGEAEILERCRTMLSTYAEHILHVGGLGMGQRAKLINNLLMTANFAMAHDAVSLGADLGLSPTLLNSVITACSGHSFAHQVYASLANLGELSKHLPVMRKDLRLVAGECGGAKDLMRLGAASRWFLDAVEEASSNHD
jgi:3-hydroxyisobutyrate dehydrogenase-like beta-hydroxyacid dehydrogenase